jgi:predicted HAD superfamily Cof-like phosphohydrolase
MSKNWQQDVAEFHKTFGLTVGDIADPKISDGDLRWQLVMEEALEFKVGVGYNRLPEAVDAIADIIYVALGAAVTFGIRMDDIWDEVHKTNMAKVGGFRDENGKWRKPDGWTPPDIEGLIERQKKNSL